MRMHLMKKGSGSREVLSLEQIADIGNECARGPCTTQKWDPSFHYSLFLIVMLCHDKDVASEQQRVQWPRELKERETTVELLGRAEGLIPRGNESLIEGIRAQNEVLDWAREMNGQSKASFLSSGNGRGANRNGNICVNKEYGNNDSISTKSYDYKK
ncbi:hypothetical protein VNO78_21950 [Psophocarpus tetragonolobus]|uniref:Uncharacterized protein n=1 Tax=Psophocarpus tetragonolobus TaxID=3891 RepID=A0AAN9XIL4_PSOTE